jgi:hypothetical protein
MTVRRVAALTALAVAAALLLVVGLRVFGHPASAAISVPGRPLVLTALPSIGTIYWRYDCAGRGPIRWSLGIRIWSTSATSGVRFRAGKLARERQLQPGDPTNWFPYSRERVQWLAAASGGEEGTAVGSVRVNYGYPSREYHCFPYAPPRVTVQFYPRRYYDSRDFLSHFTG